VLMFFACSCAWSQSGEELLRNCEKGVAQGTNPTVQDVVCVTYLKGFIAGLTVTQLAYNAPFNGAAPLASMSFVCLPKEGISSEQARRIVVKYLHDHPEELHENQQLLILTALVTAFPPCKQP